MHEAGNQRASADATGTLDRLCDDLLRERQPGNISRGGTWADGSAQEPNLADSYRDEGYGARGTGRT